MDIQAAMEHWESSDPAMAALARQTRVEARWVEDDAFTSLCRSIIHQQVSLAAGETIFGRFETLLGAIRPEAVAAAGTDSLRSVGLSGAKTRYVQALADHVLERTLDLAGLPSDDEAAIRALTAVAGIGVWTAKMHLLFHQQRPDICPWEDLGVRQSATMHFGIAETDVQRWLRDVARPKWSPFNSSAARVLWAARRNEPE